jgi:DNA-binding NarL/FixJ family response regulator
MTMVCPSCGELVSFLPNETLSGVDVRTLDALADGKTNTQIAEEWGVTIKTVKNQVTDLYKKFGIHDRAVAAIWARQRGFGVD